MVEPDLARALHNLGRAQALSGETQEALSNMQKSVSMRRKLYADDAHAHGRDFGTALINLSKLARSAKEFEMAKSAALEALPIFEALDRAQPELYKPSLAQAHFGIGAASFELGELQDAFQSGREAVRHYKASDWKSKPEITEEFAESWLFLSHCFAELSQSERALNAALEAVAVLEVAEEHPDLKFTYINALTVLSTSFAENDQNEKAVAVSKTAAQGLRELRLAGVPNVDDALRKLLEFHLEQLRVTGNTDDAELVALEIQALGLIDTRK